ncbi:alpha/beta hydrolase [Actinokineospora bangkokensis]|uniref:Alpha/beta hydrolase n=1 Tax=Actinokineospora bangkokensis TaxID=1193682 RepID=A0A1Q9LCE1_9PSEU|nr:alpha/beta hydrolase [Actinokineospora bangkokensis]OLR89684.1 alpha/beta hydrolase [Actinokineospora bangkokensis]
MSKLVNRVPVRVQAMTLKAAFALPQPLRRAIAGKPIRIDGQELALDAQLLLTLQRLSGQSLVVGDPVASRRALAASKDLVSGVPIEPVSVRGLDLDGVPARFYTPGGVDDHAPLLVFYHGGGWVIGDLDSHDNACRYLALGAQVKVLAVDYRLAPEHPFPAAVEDSVAAFRWAVAHADELGVDPARVAVGGDSAGGNLSAVVAHQQVLAGGPVPAFQLLFYPGTDGTTKRRSRELFADGFFLTGEHMDFFIDHYFPAVDQRHDPRFSVLLAQDLTGMPPAYVATAGFDPLRDEGEAFADALAAAGVPVVKSRQADLIHGYINFTGIGTRFREALSEAAGALRTGLAINSAKQRSGA